MKVFFKLFSLLFISINILFSLTQTADFFIAEDPAQFEILNQYKQKLPLSAKKAFLSNTPWQIIEENILLSDNYSKAISVKFDGQLYYFSYNQDGSLRTESTSVQFEIFKNCRLIKKSFKITLDKAVLFREIPFSYNETGYPISYLEEGNEIAQVFKKGSSYFVKIEPQKKFGWVRINNLAAIKSTDIEKEKLKSGFAEIIKTQVSQKVDEINSVYRKLFRHLNNKFAREEPIPYWQINTSENEIELNLITENPEKTKKSIAYFVNELQNMIIGQPIEINSSQSQITLKMKSDE